MPKSLITGVTGFVGQYLSELLRSEGHVVFGLDRWSSCPYPDITYVQADVLDTPALTGIIADLHPDSLFHLAAVSDPSEADASPRHALEINMMGAVSVLDAVRKGAPSARVLMVGSSKEYNDSINSEAVAETMPPDPTNFYGISKYASELIGRQYARQYGLWVVSSRSFNHTGPGQPPRFVCSDWARQVAEISKGKIPAEINVGDTGVMVDFTDVRDVVRAYLHMVEHGTTGEVYNVCSGRGTALDFILTYLIDKSTVPIAVKRAENKLKAHRTNKKMIGDNSKLHACTGWTPVIPIEKTLDDLYQWWMKKE
jgi:GDP-4-dehydro-6-deoxy-D-mannose reductase